MRGNRKRKNNVRTYKARRKRKDNPHTRDINSKKLFEDSELCSQFLRDYSNVPQFKNVRAEDIHNVTSRFVNYINTQFDSDVVNQINVHDESRDYYMIALHEHKSYVDYDVTRQILKYMNCIWERYAVECKTQKVDSSARKEFKYPIIIPIVYYEGTDPWDACMNFADRVLHEDELEKYIPNFTYIVVGIHGLSDVEILEHNDAMSLVMLINKVRNSEDARKFMNLPQDQLEDILSRTSDQTVEVVADVAKSLFLRANLPYEEVEQCVQKIRRRNMGYLFENMEKIDVQAERRRTKKVMKRVARIEKRNAEAEKRIEAGKQEIEAGKQEIEAGKQEIEAGKKWIAEKEQQMERTIHIIRLNYQGKTDEEIAGQLNCSMDEVKEALIKIRM